MNYKICPRCLSGVLYIFKKSGIDNKIILCDECDAMWLDSMDIHYGVYGKDFYDYTEYMTKHGINNIWDQEDMFNTPLME